MMKFNTSLVFNGNCREAVEYYARVFDKVAKIMTFSQVPSGSGFPQPEGMEDKIMHAEIEITENFTLMMADNMPHWPYQPGNTYSIVITSEDLAEIQKMYDKLKNQSEVVMELQKTFWSPAYAFLIDRYGVHWMLNCTKM